MSRGAVQFARDIFPGKNRTDPLNRHRSRFIYRSDARMGVRRSEQFEVQHPLDVDIERVSRLAGYNVVRGRRQNALPQRGTGWRFLGYLGASNSVLDAVIASASAKIPLHHAREFQPVLFIEAGNRHYRTRGAETALKARCIHEGLLYGVEFAILGKSFDRGYLVPFGTKSRN